MEDRLSRERHKRRIVRQLKEAVALRAPAAWAKGAWTIGETALVEAAVEPAAGAFGFGSALVCGQAA